MENFNIYIKKVLYICTVTKNKNNMYNQNKNNEYHEMLKQKYGNDIAFYILSVNAIMDAAGVEPKFSEQVKAVVKEWHNSAERYDYYTGNLEKKLFEINNSEAMHKLARRMSSTAYHMEEASCGQL